MATKKDSAMTEAAKAMGSRGGKARAKALPAKERQRIASEAAKKRWADKAPPAEGSDG